jgi:hypothetical protein
MSLKKMAISAVMAGGLGLTAVGGAAAATADDDFDVPGPGDIEVPHVDFPNVPDVDVDLPDIDVPDHLPPPLPPGETFGLPLGPGPGVLAPPGHIGQIIGVPPGQWGKVRPVQLLPLMPFCPDLDPGCINQL